ncbi:MAG: hypothetical protein CMH79_04895 [Nitrospinae bacterium]|nr:hypothetical protein [Nitrospinota bacterium]|tara:strand:+ start:894 stop:1100 length:207 start_codon:yes stop_codon:yes gene_type:complete
MSLKSYYKLSKEDLINIIEKKDNEIKNLLENIEVEKGFKDYYLRHNKFHIEEITRLDRIIGQYKGVRK